MRIKRDTKRTPNSSTNGVKNTGGARYNCDDSKNPRKAFKMMPVDNSNDERNAAPNRSESLSWVSLPGKNKSSGRMKMACRTWIKPRPKLQRSIPSVNSGSIFRDEAPLLSPETKVTEGVVAAAAVSFPSFLRLARYSFHPLAHSS